MKQLTTLGEHLHFAERLFRKAKLYFGHGTNNPWDEAVAIALFVLKLDPNSDAGVTARVLSQDESAEFLALVDRRIAERKPVPYLTQEAWFAGQKYYVDERVIIPRSPFAELIENKFEPWLNQSPSTILDLCSGSACMAIACAYAFPDAQIVAIDISKDALSVAEKNIREHGFVNRIQLIESNLFQNCPKIKFDLILSNPPYVDEQDMHSLPLEFHHEPKLALASGLDGLVLTDQILSNAAEYLSDKGHLFVEVGNSAAALVKKYPHLPFIWIDLERGGEGIFLLNKADLQMSSATQS